MSCIEICTIATYYNKIFSTSSLFQELKNALSCISRRAGVTE